MGARSKTSSRDGATEGRWYQLVKLATGTGLAIEQLVIDVQGKGIANGELGIELGRFVVLTPDLLFNTPYSSSRRKDHRHLEVSTAASCCNLFGEMP